MCIRDRRERERESERERERERETKEEKKAEEESNHTLDYEEGNRLGDDYHGDGVKENRSTVQGIQTPGG